MPGPTGKGASSAARRSARRRCFTLIELLVVVAVIAILAAIAVPNFLEAQTRAKVSRALADLKSAATALEIYRTDGNQYPPTPKVQPSFNDESFRVLSNRLSTPVSYLSNAALRDPFLSGVPDFHAVDDGGAILPYLPILPPAFHTEAFDPLAGRRLYYNSNRDPGTTGLGSGDPLGIMVRSQVGEWILASLGPDGKRNRYPSSQIELFAYLVRYDPTNGTVSAGDIVRAQKEPPI